MIGVCKYNKMINCETYTRCAKCTWNPEYYEELKKKRREEAKAKEQSDNEKES